jgi:demethylspheroidene O-methyltransferase
MSAAGPMVNAQPLRETRERPAWRRALDARIDRWLADPGLYRWAVANPFTRWLTRRRADRLFELMAGFVHSQVLLACVRLRLFETVYDAPRTLEELSAACGVPASSLERLLRSAVALRLLTPRGGGRYGLGPMGRPVAADAGLRKMIEHNAVLYEDLRDPLALMRGGADAAMHAYWPYTQSVDPQTIGSWAPDKVALYSDLMASSQRFLIDELLAAYPFGDHARVMDVGGGKGAWITALAGHAPDLDLTLFDLPPVADLARVHLEQGGVAARVQVHGGSFTRDALPRGADLVTLLRVAHDHPDHVVLALLAAVHDALPVGGTLLLAEPMAEAEGQPATADAYFHFYLLAMGAGRLRTPQELFHLMAQAGFTHLEQVPNAMPLHGRILLGRKSGGLPGVNPNQSSKSVNLN